LIFLNVPILKIFKSSQKYIKFFLKKLIKVYKRFIKNFVLKIKVLKLLLIDSCDKTCDINVI